MLLVRLRAVRFVAVTAGIARLPDFATPSPHTLKRPTGPFPTGRRGRVADLLAGLKKIRVLEEGHRLSAGVGAPRPSGIGFGEPGAQAAADVAEAHHDAPALPDDGPPVFHRLRSDLSKLANGCPRTLHRSTSSSPKLATANLGLDGSNALHSQSATSVGTRTKAREAP